MPKYKIEWYLDHPGCDGHRELEVEAKDEEEAREVAWDILFANLVVGEVTKILVIGE